MNELIPAQRAKLAANWVIGDLSAALNRSSLDLTQSPVSSAQLGEMIAQIKDGTISGKIAKQVFEPSGRKVALTELLKNKVWKQMALIPVRLKKLSTILLLPATQQVENYRGATNGAKMLGFWQARS